MNYQLNSYVNHQEAEALKDMIFKRVRERSQAMTDDVQADIMSIARESLVPSSNNPFAQLINKDSIKSEDSFEKTTQAISVETSENKEDIKIIAQKANEQIVSGIESDAKTEIGFPQKANLSGALTQNKIIKEQMTASQIQNNMIEARQGLTNKQSFMGALSFLNSQAAVSLLRTRTDKFEIMA